MPRETLPGLTAREAGRYLRGAADRLGLEFVESAGVAPIFLLLPRGGGPPAVTLFQTWHAEPAGVEPAAVDGAERLALGTAVAAAGATARIAFVVAPSSSAGSRGLDEALRAYRDRLAAGAAYWIRVTPGEASGRGRRRVFLGARGRVVIALRGGDGNPYRARDAVVQALREEAYGPRPLDFELLRKLASGPEPLALIGATGEEGGGRDGGSGSGSGSGGGRRSAEERLRAALFDPRGEVVIPAVPHPDRPRAWLMFETAEAMEAEAIASRVEALSGGGRAEAVENFPWDRANIHHPAIHALIELSRAVSEGPEIWPSAPWATPSGVFSRALGLGLAEWGIPLAPGAQVRFPKPEEFETMTAEAGRLLVKASAEGA
ncbi:MAG TPA: hypothetical protein VL503_07705 [Candidatus Omnitrophota bacterium]|nr:hypothetical protein [Candidatus Omnitrophota bacterium]